MAKRRKAQARRSSDRRIPLWIWLFGGVLIGLGMAAGLLIWNRDGQLALPVANPFATAPRASEPAVAPPPAPVAERPKPRYDFYTLLRERETKVSDQELAERVQAEATPTVGTTPADPAMAARERYLIQAGAFRDQRDAEATKARIALAGFQARVEAANVNGADIYRVRLGPYATASALEKAKSKLAANGVTDTLAVREALD
ncbi:MAG: SPOR domain-containing protein [Xanthomonadales bacterium]|nr:SPOR domain-containing protein [Xanthomonadales bacterium]